MTFRFRKNESHATALDDSFAYTIALGGATFSTATDYVGIAPDAQISVARKQPPDSRL